jgi:hypothetical protein
MGSAETVTTTHDTILYSVCTRYIEIEGGSGALSVFQGQNYLAIASDSGH